MERSRYDVSHLPKALVAIAHTIKEATPPTTVYRHAPADTCGGFRSSKSLVRNG